MKIAVIGGGSTYTPELIHGFSAKGAILGVKEICLQDTDKTRLQIVGSFCRRLLRSSGATGISLQETSSLVEAVTGSSFVLIQIRVGGQQARHKDILLGLKHGLIGQETTGIGGFAKALRTIPVVLEICKAVERHAPSAWILNFTNPSGLVTEAILSRTGLKALGLCNIPMDVKISIAKELGVPQERVKLDYVGLNHLSWVRRVLIDGRDVLPEILEEVVKKGTPKNIPDLDYDPRLLHSLGMLPMYYLRYYYYPEKMLRMLKEKEKTRAQEVMEIEHELLALYRDESVLEKPALLDQRGGAYYSLVAVELIEALCQERPSDHIVNTANGTSTPDLGSDAVIECTAQVSSAGAHPLPIGPLDPRIKGLIQAVKSYEALTIQAAVERNRSAALWALVTHPLGPPGDRAIEILDELVEINQLEGLRA